MTSLRVLYVLLIVLTFASDTLCNTPPLLTVDREWDVTDDDPVGTVVTRIRVDAPDHRKIKFSIRKAGFGEDGSPYFEVDKIGRVKLKKSFAGKAGRSMFLKVTATDGNIPFSSEVRVLVSSGKHIQRPSGLLGALNPRPPPNFPGNFNHPSRPLDAPFYNVHNSNPDETPPILELPLSGVWSVPSTLPVGGLVDTVKAFDITDAESFTYAIKDDNGYLTINANNGDVTTLKKLQVGDYGVTVTVTNKHGTSTGRMVLRVLKSDVTMAPIVPHHTTEADDSVEDHPGLIAIIKNGPTPPESTTTAQPTKTDDVQEPTNSTQVVFIVFPLLGVTAVISLFAFFCCKSKASKTPIKKEDSAMKFDKKALQVTPVSSNASNSSSTVLKTPLPSIMRFWSRRASQNSYEENQKPIFSQRKVSKDSTNSFSYDPSDEWEFPRHKLKVISILGEGCFGQVWKYEAQDISGADTGKSYVAVKTLKESAGTQERNDLQQELKVLKSLGKHPNVVSLLACCTEKEPTLVVLEYLVNGKLQTYLRDRRGLTPYNNLHGPSSSLTPRDLTIFALQVAKGMDYLSTHGIVHRDLAARNVLVGEDKVCKVADFGFARDIANNHVYERKSDGRLPIRWMAIESLYDNIFTSKTDVWSFGILLWEIITLGSTPYPGMSAEEVMKRIREGYRLEKPSYCKREVYNIMYYCWYDDPKERPTFKELMKHLEDLITAEVDYIEINKFPERCYYNVSVAAASGELL